MGATLKCGTCRSFLTPPLGVELEGTFARRKASGVLSDLEVNTVVLDDGAAELAFLSVDVCVIEDAVVEELLSRIHDASGIPKHCIFITATHTHSAPTLGSGLFDAAEPDVLYIALAKKIIVSSVVRAQSAKHPVTMTAGQSKNADYQFNRRLHRPDGSIIANFVKDPLIAQAVSSGETDPALFVAKLTDENGKAVALFVNYGQHNNAVSCTLITADMAGEMRSILRRVYGEEIVIHFAMGAAGDVNWIDHTNPDWDALDSLRVFGRSLAGSVLQADAASRPVDVGHITVERRILDIPDRPLQDYDLCDDLTFGTGEIAQDNWAGYHRIRDYYRAHPALAQNELAVSVVAFSPELAIAAVPVEIFCAFTLDLRKHSPFRNTMTYALTNGYGGYVCTHQAFREGGYEVRKAPGGSHLSVDAGYLIFDEIKDMLKAASKRGGSRGKKGENL